MDRFDAMEVLLAVVDAGSLSAGSRKLNAPLPSVSRKVAELERHLGTRLLIRTSRNIQLTDAGRDYVEAARRLIGDLQEAELRASGEYQRPRGVLTITMTTDFGRLVVLPFAYEFLNEHPEVTLDILTTTRFVDLTEERADVGVRVGHLSDSSLFAVKIGTIRVVTCASPEYLERKGHPERPEDLVRHDGVQFGNFSRAWLFPDGSTFREGRPTIRVHTDDVTAACVAAVRGLGISRLPNFMITEELRSGSLVEVFGDFRPEPMPAHLVYVRQGLLPLKVRAFLDWMTPRLRQKLRDIDEDCDRLNSGSTEALINPHRS